MDQAEELRAIVKAGQQNTCPLARVITITSGKGGVGKSNTAVNLAIQLKNMGQRVIILDADFGLANVEIMFGMAPRYNLCDLIYQGKGIREIITWGTGEVGFISGGSGIASLANMGKEELAYIIQNLTQLDTLADVIIIDTGAGISDAVLDFLVISGEILLVTTPEPTSITDAYSVLKALNRHPRFSAEESRIRLVANRVASLEDGEVLFNKLNMVVKRYLKLPVDYLGAVPQDSHLVEAVMRQKPVSLSAPSSKSARAYERMARKLVNPVFKTEKKRGIAAFFSQFISGKK